MNNLLLTICARGGSKGVKGKNIKDLAGKPLIYYTIKQAKEWGKAQHIVVSTDSKEIATIAKEFGAEVPFLRPGELATDTAGKVGVIRHALKFCEDIYKKKFDAVMDLDTTSPLRKVEDLEKAFNLFLSKKPKTLFSVVKAHRNPYFNMVEEDSEGKAQYSKSSGGFSRRQDAPKVYDMNASIYIYDREYLLDENNNKPVSDNSIIYLMDEISRIDIDSEMDFKFIEFLVKENIISL
ncbi:hypothetical protein A3C59_00460 [Candidatus Daviesbacteria bacterium RIFCSPHIGHO2_02_FULL_36_13]|uniref:Flagellar modification protein B n=1 Tax=Candidatus Daviesbacteria bacterium RIFCSPHIGHO2_02_FULL_36_13 TaxID=1797768 RepID=A0A1F5JP50_9BACT|nr:MAG: hypothetical protein A3C59_00460 [Candidatus Daviesbacteria bacterium RIFCSPHIGHO2_02_FULL_36_13]